MQCCPTLTLVTGVTNCRRGLGKEKEKTKQDKSVKLALQDFSLEPRGGRGALQNPQSRTSRTGENTPPWAHEGKQSERETVIMRDRHRE